jgi:hypothetical protein
MNRGENVIDSVAGFVSHMCVSGLGISVGWGDTVYKMSVNPVLKQGMGSRVNVVFEVEVA